MASTDHPAPSPGGLARRLSGPAKVLIVSSVMFTFISYWRTAAVVLCDLASTAYYIGGIVEDAIGPAAPWFILGVMCFSYFVRMVYIESCTLFIRGGVYKVVRAALGRVPAKLAVSALMFDYILTGPISGVSAGQYIIGLGFDSLTRLAGVNVPASVKAEGMNTGAVIIACAITAFFFWQNIRGIHESSGRALQIMAITTVMAVFILGWSVLTLFVSEPNWHNLRQPPDLMPKVEYQTAEGRDPQTGQAEEVWKVEGPHQQPVPATDEQGNPVPRKNPVTGLQEDPLGFLAFVLPPSAQDALRRPDGWGRWFGLAGLLAFFIAFGHSILAMSGEETLAQVYREVESPKLQNFKKAAFIVFIYSLLFTGGICILAVVLVPNSVRMKVYHDNLISGLTMYLWGPVYLRLLLNAAVVFVGFLILAGAVNTSIIGSNGVLNRVAEDGVMPDWFLKPHPRFGTTHRILWLIFLLQLFTILVTWGNVLVLGEAYAFGVIWSFVFQALSMVVLRFKDRRPREYMVPINIKVGDVYVPLGLGFVLLILLGCAIMNLLTKEVATIAGGVFTAAFFTIFWASERYYERRRAGGHHEHLEQFNRVTTDEITPLGLGLTKPYRMLVAIRSPWNLFMLEKALAEVDPDTTNVIVMTAKLLPPGSSLPEQPELDAYDQELMTAVVQKAEQAGKEVKPLIIPTNNPLHAALKTAQDLHVQEVIMGASNKWTADEQLEQIAFVWISLHHGETAPLTVRILSRDRDMYLDLAGGNRIPKVSERARTIAELRAAGVGVDRVLLVHDGSPGSSDLFQGVLTMLDPEVVLGLVSVVPPGSDPYNGPAVVHQDEERAEKLGRPLQRYETKGPHGPEIVRLAREGHYDLIILAAPPEQAVLPRSVPLDERTDYVIRHAHCRVQLALAPGIPTEVVDTTPSRGTH
jgi:amino acid transporter/nucleotide-binding universal stress UspA family protein